MLTDVAATGVVLDQRTARLLPPMFEPAAVYLAFDERLRNNIMATLTGRWSALRTYRRPGSQPGTGSG